MVSGLGLRNCDLVTVQSCRAWKDRFWIIVFIFWIIVFLLLIRNRTGIDRTSLNTTLNK